MLNKTELEKLKIDQKLECFNEEDEHLYDLKITKIKWGTNGIRYKTEYFNNKLESVEHIIPKFTINSCFNNSGLHNPPNKFKRYYKLIEV